MKVFLVTNANGLGLLLNNKCRVCVCVCDCISLGGKDKENYTHVEREYKSVKVTSHLYTVLFLIIIICSSLQSFLSIESSVRVKLHALQKRLGFMG